MTARYSIAWHEKDNANFSRFIGFIAPGISRRTGTSPIDMVEVGTWHGLELWLRMQQAHDLWYAEQRLHGELARIPAHGLIQKLFAVLALEIGQTLFPNPEPAILNRCVVRDRITWTLSGNTRVPGVELT